MGRAPRIELHCHLDGSLTRGLLSELLGRNVDEGELTVASDCRDLAEYLKRFDLPLTCLQSETGLKRAGYDFMRSMHDNAMDYVEVRFAPQLSTREGLTNRRVIEAVLDGLNEGKRAYGVEYNVIVCAMRHLSDEDNIAMIKAAREFYGCGVCAVDLAGDEASYPMENYIELFRYVKSLDMPFTIHAGECGRAHNISLAVSCGASRIGHGIAMYDDYEVMELCRRKRIGIEMCPISNFQTKAATAVELYPMRKYLDNNMLVTINTDNRTVSGTDFDKELEFATNNLGINEHMVEQMLFNAVEVAFADDSIKDRLLKL